MTGNNHYCLGCMSIIKDEEKCSCGFDENSYKLQSQWLSPGTILNDSILIGKVIGDGGFGITYIGLDLNLEMKVAVKEFYMNGYCGRNTLVSNDILTEGKDKTTVFESNKDKFIDEARILARFTDELGIVSVNRFFKENNTAYIVMEYVDGQSLNEYIANNGRLSIKETLIYIAPIINSLEKIHSQNIYHRDISPDNIILTKGQEMKLLDFGSAREKLEEYQTMTVVYKRSYSPIEQYEKHGKQGPWTDIYSLCSTIYFCVTGITPDSAYDRFMNDTMAEAHEAESSCDLDFSAIISKGMAIDYEERYQSIGELKTALAEYINNHLSDYGRDFFSYSHLGNVKKENNKEDANKDYLIVKKKVLAKIALIILSIICITGIVFGITKNIEKTDKEIIYLTYPKEADNAQISNAIDIINNRLQTVFGRGNYSLKSDEDKSTITINLDNDYSQNFVYYYMFRPNNLSLVYFTDFTEESLDISLDDIVSVSYDDELEKGYIELSDSAAEKIIDQMNRWIKITEPDEHTKNNLGGTVIKYEEYAPFSYNLEHDKTNAPSPEEFVKKAIRLMFDYDLWKSGAIENSDRVIIELSIENEGHKLFITNPKDFQNIKAAFDNHLFSANYDIAFKTNTSLPTIWERNLDKNELITSGLYQKDFDYFSRNNITSADVVFNRDEKNRNLGDWVNYRKYIQDVLDTAQIEYSLGSLADKQYSLVLRLPIEYAEKGIYGLLAKGSSAIIRLATLDYTNGDLINGDYIEGEYIKWPVRFTEGNVYLELIGLEEYESKDGSNSVESYNKFLNDLKKYSNKDVYWRIEGSSEYLAGAYDKEHNTLIFSKSSYSADNTIPQEFNNYISVLNTIYAVDSRGYSFDYLYVQEQNANKDYNSITAPVNHFLNNRINDVILQNTKDKLSQTLGVEPNIELSGTTFYITIKQSITENYAKNLTRIINSIIDANIFANNGAYTLYSSDCIFRINSLDDSNQANISIQDREKHISIFFWRDSLSDNEKTIFDKQLRLINEIISSKDEFSGYTVEINNVY